MDIFIFVSILFVLQLVCLWAGKQAAQSSQNQKAYFLADKDIRFFPLLMTFIATQIGGGLVIGAAEEAYRIGWAVLLYPLGACLGFVVLALGIGKQLAQFQVSTVAELLQVVYRSSRLKKIASLLSIISLLMILVAQVIASRKFMISLDLDYSLLFFIFWGIVVIYTVIGGLKAVVSIDIIQAFFFIVVFVFSFSYILMSDSVEFSKLISTPINVTDGNSSLDLHKLSGWLLMPLLFMVIEQDMAQRCFAAYSPRVVTKAAGCAALSMLVICFIPVCLGVIGKVIGLTLAPSSSVFMEVVQILTTPAITAFVACAVLMAILSTAISLLNAISSNLSQDFDFSWLRNFNSMQIAKSVTACIGLLAVISSFYIGGIVSLLIQSYELSVGCLFVPVCAALFKRQGNYQSAWLAVILGGGGFWLTRMFESELPKEIVSLLMSAIGYLIGELWVKYSQPKLLVSQDPQNLDQVRIVIK